MARDRAFGGLVRAGTRNLANGPAQDKDPIAWEAFHRGISDPPLMWLAHPPSA